MKINDTKTIRMGYITSQDKLCLAEMFGYDTELFRTFMGRNLFSITLASLSN